VLPFLISDSGMPTLPATVTGAGFWPGGKCCPLPGFWQVATGSAVAVVVISTSPLPSPDSSPLAARVSPLSVNTGSALAPPLRNYPTALANGWPIATGVIEGACRHLVKDRMDITGARWGLHGAETVLKLRAIAANNDLDDYWTYHLNQEHQRIHQSRYAGHVLPTAA
jgi:hypothetical protein